MSSKGLNNKWRVHQNVDLSENASTIAAALGVLSVQKIHCTYWFTADGSDADWPELCHVGKSQSPINLSPSNAIKGTLGDFQFTGYNGKYNTSITNNGYTVEVRFLDADMFVEGANLNGVYKFDHIHFHWPCEHTISEKRFPFEMHFVHQKINYSTTEEALKYSDGLAVLGFLFDFSVEGSPFLNPIVNEVISVTEYGSTKILREMITPNDFLPKDLTGLYRYNGSLTTPPCSESVIWTVFKEIFPISARQFNTFRLLLSDEGKPVVANYRLVKPLNGRVIIDQEGSGKKDLGFYKNILEECFG